MFTSFLSGGVVGSAGSTTNGPLLDRMIELPTDTPAGIGLRDSIFNQVKRQAQRRPHGQACHPEIMSLLCLCQGRDCMGTATHVSQGPFAPLPSINSCPTALTATHSLQRVSSSCASCAAAAEAAQSLQQCQAAVQAALQLQAAEQVQAASQLVPPERRTVFFAGVPPMVMEQQLLLVFSNVDTVEQINLFKPFNNSRTSKVCCAADRRAGTLSTVHARVLGRPSPRRGLAGVLCPSALEIDAQLAPCTGQQPADMSPTEGDPHACPDVACPDDLTTLALTHHLQTGLWARGVCDTRRSSSGNRRPPRLLQVGLARVIAWCSHNSGPCLVFTQPPEVISAFPASPTSAYPSQRLVSTLTCVHLRHSPDTSQCSAYITLGGPTHVRPWWWSGWTPAKPTARCAHTC